MCSVPKLNAKFTFHLYAVRRTGSQCAFENEDTQNNNPAESSDWLFHLQVSFQEPLHHVHANVSPGLGMILKRP
jgi:hypothetical protein